MNQNNREEKERWRKEFIARLIKFSVDILHFASDLEKERILQPIANQIVRSATSIGANVSEAHGAGTKKDFAFFFQVALKSAKETQYWLLVIKQYDSKRSKKSEILLSETQELVRIINSSLLTLRGKK